MGLKINRKYMEQSPSTNKAKSGWLLLIGLATATFFLVLLFRKLEWQSVGLALQKANIGFVLLGLLLLAMGFTTRITRWWWILRVIEPDLPWQQCVRPFLGSLAVNNTFPLRAGDVLRIVGFSQDLKSSPMQVLGTLVIERLLDFFVLLSLFFLGLLGLGKQTLPPTLLQGAIVLGSVCLISLLSLILFPRQIEQVLQGILRKFNWSRLEKAVTDLFTTLSLLSSPKLSLEIVAISVMAWLFEGGMFAAVAASVQVNAQFIAPWFALTTGTLATLIPSSPGYIGTFHYFTRLGLMSYGAQLEIATAFALLVHVLLWLPVTIVGGLLLLSTRSTNTPKKTIKMTADKNLENSSKHIVIIGGGFTGLTAAYQLSKFGFKVTVLEQDSAVGGLAGSFIVNGESLEKFYHHWFTNDQYVMELVEELKAQEQVVYRPTRTGMYYANNFFKLSSPLDLLKFKPLNWVDRFRLGFLVIQAKSVKNWQLLESQTAEEWLIKLCGREVYRVIWEPLLRGKFGPFATEISAVWFWNKLKLRGGSRSKDGGEMLAYYRGGFAALAARIADEVTNNGGQIKLGTSVKNLLVERGKVVGVETSQGVIKADLVIATPALPIIADIIEPHLPSDYIQRLRKIDYLANVCLVLELDRSLSDTYWLNVNEPNFPFVGVIEHTNFEPKETYGGRHIIYLSKYLPESSQLYQMSPEEALNFSIPYLARMFPEFSRDWIIDYHFWRARYSQPIVVRHYSNLIPERKSPLAGLYIATMAQIYPEDRGTNYAIREGRSIAHLIAQDVAKLN